MRELPRKRFFPYQVMVYLLYGTHEGIIQRDEFGVATLKVGPASRRLRVTASRLKEGLKWLQEQGLVEWMVYRKGTALLKLQRPDFLGLKLKGSAGTQEGTDCA